MLSTSDPLVQRVVNSMITRSERGMKTYGQSMEDNNSKTLTQWIVDVQEELLDAAIYLEKVKAKIKEHGLENVT